MEVHGANNGVEIVKMDGKELNDRDKYLVNGVPSITGTLGSGGCTAFFESTTGTLTLQNYNGGMIQAGGAGLLDINIKLVGTNKITKIGSGKLWGIRNTSAGGDINITSVNNASLTIELTSTDNFVYGIAIDPSGGSTKGNVTIGGKVDLKVNVTAESTASAMSAIGIYAKENVTIKDNVSYEAICKSNTSSSALQAGTGIYAKKGAILTTTGTINIDTSQCGVYNYGIQGSSANKLENVKDMTIKWKHTVPPAQSHGAPIIPSEFSNQSQVEANYLIKKDTTNHIATYRTGTQRTLTVTGGSDGEGKDSNKYLAGDSVEVTAKAPEKNFKFKEWTATGLSDDYELESNPLILDMPDNDVQLTANYEQTVYTVQPENATGYVRDEIGFNWTIGEYLGTASYAIFQTKNGANWEDFTLPSEYENPGNHTWSVYSDVAGSKTYRLNYYIFPETFLSNEFTLTWSPAEITGITMSPTTASVEKGETKQFTATVAGNGSFDHGVTWKVEYPNSGSTKITQDGLLTVSSSETATTLTVTGTAKGDVGKRATATVTVKEPAPTIMGVSISPETVNLRKSGKQQFTANVSGTGAYNDAVTWTMTGHDSHSTLSNTGYLKLTNYENIGNVITVTATSVANPSIKGTATVTIVNPTITNVVISPKTVTLQKGTTQEFTATVTGSEGFDPGVTWSVIDNTDTTTKINTEGVLTVGLNETATTFTVHVSSKANGTKKDIATVTVVDVPTITKVTVSPIAPKVQKGTTQNFTAIVEGTGIFNDAVSWNVTGGKVGTNIDADGKLTIAVDESASSLSVVATSLGDSTKQGYATVTVTNEAVPKFTVTVTNGSGDGSFEEGDIVTIDGDAGLGPFSKWIVKSGGVSLADIYSKITTFVMPASNVEIEATYKDPAVTWININGQKLDETNKYLKNGLASSTGTLGIDGCTAYFDSTTGTLTLENYLGTRIENRSTTKGDLNIKLIGNSTITEVGSGQMVGVWNDSGGDINITADTSATLNIDISSTTQARGITGDFGSTTSGDINISGQAIVIIKVKSESDTTQTVNGIFAADSVMISDKAYVEVIANGIGTHGIFAKGKITINTDKKMKVESHGTNDGSGALYVGSSIYLNKVETMVLVSASERVTNRDVIYDESKFVMNETLDGGYKTQTFRPGIPYEVKVTKGSGSGKYLKDDPVTVAAYKPEEFFVFKEWIGSGLSSSYDLKSNPLVFNMPANEVTLEATYEDTRFNLKVNGGRSYYDGLKQPGTIVTILARDPDSNFKFKEWEGTEGLTFTEGTSKTSSTMKFIMPSKNLELTATYEDTLFLVQPLGGTAYAGEDINFSWTISEYTGPCSFIILQKYEDGEWKTDTNLPKDPYKNFGLHTSSITNDNIESKEYRLYYYISGMSIFSEPFDMTWTAGDITGVVVSPSPVDVQKGTSQQFTGSVSGIGPYNKNVTWSLSNNKSPNTTLGFTTGLLNIGADETATTLTVTAVAQGDYTKTGTAIVNVKNEPVLKYQLTVTGGIGTGMYDKNASITINANTPPTGKQFMNWTASGISLSKEVLRNNPLAIKMPPNEVTLVANYEPLHTFTIKSSTGTGGIGFTSKFEGYEPYVPSTVTITNTGNQTVTLIQPTAIHFEVGALSRTEVEAGGTATFTIGPKTGKSVGKYREDITLSTTKGTSVTMKGFNFEINQKELTGTVAIVGIEKFGGTLTASTSASNNTGTLTYTWKYGTTNVGTGTTYTLKKEDIGKVLICEVTSSIETGKISKSSGTIGKADGPGAPTGLATVKPTSAGGVDGKITGTTNLMEYADNTGFTGAKTCTATETTGLKAGTYYVRIKATETHNAGKYVVCIVEAGKNYELWKISLIKNDPKHPWTIKLNMLVDESSINSNSVYILDENNQKLSFITPKGRNDEKFGYIDLKNGGEFIKNKDYWIIIEDTVKSKKGIFLKIGIKCKFTIE